MSIPTMRPVSTSQSCYLDHANIARLRHRSGWAGRETVRHVIPRVDRSDAHRKEVQRYLRTTSFLTRHRSQLDPV